MMSKNHSDLIWPLISTSKAFHFEFLKLYFVASKKSWFTQKVLKVWASKCPSTFQMFLQHFSDLRVFSPFQHRMESRVFDTQNSQSMGQFILKSSLFTHGILHRGAIIKTHVTVSIIVIVSPSQKTWKWKWDKQKYSFFSRGPETNELFQNMSWHIIYMPSASSLVI